MTSPRLRAESLIDAARCWYAAAERLHQQGQPQDAEACARAGDQLAEDGLRALKRAEEEERKHR